MLGCQGQGRATRQSERAAPPAPPPRRVRLTLEPSPICASHTPQSSSFPLNSSANSGAQPAGSNFSTAAAEAAGVSGVATAVGAATAAAPAALATGLRGASGLCGQLAWRQVGQACRQRSAGVLVRRQRQLRQAALTWQRRSQRRLRQRRSRVPPWPRRRQREQRSPRQRSGSGCVAGGRARRVGEEPAVITAPQAQQPRAPLPQ